MVWEAERDQQVRTAAMDWLSARTHDGHDALRTEEIAEFTFEGQRFPLLDAQRGIRKPKELAAALSIRTTYRAEGAKRPYADDLGIDGLRRYQWCGDNPDHADNRALRQAMHERLPLIWFWGIGPGLYKPVFPIYLIDEEISQRQFVVATDGLQHLTQTGSQVEAVLRRYLRQETYRRLHQPVFRSMVMKAYRTRCSVCDLAHGILLDAAHIVEDGHELGQPTVRNGLALCKIHHAAYDAGILGVTPDLQVEVRGDLLMEIDGPMLEHGLKGVHGAPLRVVPHRPSERPDPDLLEIRYARFRAS